MICPNCNHEIPDGGWRTGVPPAEYRGVRVQVWCPDAREPDQVRTGYYYPPIGWLVRGKDEKSERVAAWQPMAKPPTQAELSGAREGTV